MMVLCTGWAHFSSRSLYIEEAIVIALWFILFLPPLMQPY